MESREWMGDGVVTCSGKCGCLYMREGVMQEGGRKDWMVAPVDTRVD